MMKNLFLIVLLTLPLLSLGIDKKYSISNISLEMLKGTDLVVREYTTDFVVHSAKTATIKVTKAITVFNEKGYEEAKFSVVSDKLQGFKLHYVNIYDAEGKIVKTITKKALYVAPVVTGAVYIDGNINFVEPKYHEYPFTVVYHYSVLYKGTVEYDDWMPVSGYNVGVEDASLRLIFPSELKVRTQGVIEQAEFLKQENAGQTHMLWHISNFLPVHSKPLDIPAKEVLPYIEIAPSFFEAENYSGEMLPWEKFGLWLNDLNEGLQELPEEAKQKVHTAISGLTEKRDRVAEVYKILQSNSRYVSIQIGIGGWQPASATDTWNSGYGDCKALSNLMCSLLMEAGIRSHYAVIKAGKRDLFFDEDFPANHFNHVIVCVPLQNDTIWLECTSQTSPCNYLGDFTSDRHALLATEKGGVLVKTPGYSARQNCQKRSADMNIDYDFDATAVVAISYSGDLYSNEKRRFYNLDDEDRKLRISKLFNLSSIFVKEVNTQEYTDAACPKFLISTRLNIFDPVVVISNRIILSPTMFSESSDVIAADIKNQSFVITDNKSTIDSIAYHFTVPMMALNLPENINLVTQFGEYIVKYEFEDNTLYYTRVFIQKKGVYLPEDMSDYVSFSKQINKSDSKKIAFQRIE